jgi:hypothetical protein
MLFFSIFSYFARENFNRLPKNPFFAWMFKSHLKIYIIQMAFNILILFFCIFYKKSQRFLCSPKTKLKARIGVASDGLVKPRLVRLPGMDRASNLFLMCPLYTVCVRLLYFVMCIPWKTFCTLYGYYV